MTPIERESDQIDEEIHRRRRAKRIDPHLLVTAACRLENKQDQLIVGWRVRGERMAQERGL